MDTRNENTSVMNNQTNPVNNPQGMRPQPRPGTMPPPAMQPKTPGDNQDSRRAMLAAAAIILGGTVGVGGAMAADAIGDKFDENEADIEKAMQETRDARQQAEEAMKEAEDAQKEADAARAQAAQQPKVVHVDHIHEPEDDMKVFYYQHVVDENGNEMDIAYVERNGVRGYYADVDTDGKADYFLPETATSSEEIINLHDYGEVVRMDTMAQEAQYVFTSFNATDDGGTAVMTGFDDGGGTAVMTGFNGDEPDNDDVFIAQNGGDGPDYTNTANVENMTGTVTSESGTYLGGDDVAMLNEGDDSDVTIYPEEPEDIYPEDLYPADETDDIDIAQNDQPYDDMDSPADTSHFDDIDMAQNDTVYDDPQPDNFIEQNQQDPFLADNHMDTGIEDPAIDGSIS